MLTRHDPTVHWRSALWILVIVAASLGFSRAFACATPFVGLATLAGTQMRLREATVAVVLAWLTNQAIGFLLLGYPHTPSTYFWGVAIGIAALVALTTAGALAHTKLYPALRMPLAFVAAFAGFEGVLYATALLLHAGTAAFAATVIGRIFAINAIAYAGLYLMHRVAMAWPVFQSPRHPHSAHANLRR